MSTISNPSTEPIDFREIDKALYTGKKYGMLTAIEFVYRPFHGPAHWKFQCDCGGTKTTSLQSVVRGKTVSCGCYRSRARKFDEKLDIAGQKFGKLTAHKYYHRVLRTHYWSFRCDCGNYKSLDMSRVISGSVTSCGCDKKVKPPITVHDSTTPEYYVWKDIRTKCLNRKSGQYHRYGGVGIKMCERWANSYDAFREDMGCKPSKDHRLERINERGDYSPENCKWVRTPKICKEVRVSKEVRPFSGVYSSKNGWMTFTNITGHPQYIGTFRTREAAYIAKVAREAEITHSLLSS
jgi:hypothetical protein